MKLFANLIVAVTLGCTVAPLYGADDLPYRPKVGDFHPDFTLPQIENRKPLTLSSYRGKKVLLLHFASW